MKFTTQLSAGLVGLSLLVTASAQDAVKFNVPGVNAPAPKPAAPAATPAAPAPQAAPAAPAAVKYTDSQLMEAYGYIFMFETRMASQLQALEISPALKESFVRGMTLAVNGGDFPHDGQQIQPQLQEFLGRKQAAYLGKIKAQQTAVSAEYFTKLKENKAVVELPSGLRYEILKPGTGPVAKPGQVMTIHYTGSLASGQVFDDSRERNQPAELLLQASSAQNPQGVIAGMFEGLQKTGVGGKLKLHIPAALAYGDEGAPGAIPPGAALIFDIEILGVKDAPPAPAPAAK